MRTLLEAAKDKGSLCIHVNPADDRQLALAAAAENGCLEAKELKALPPECLDHVIVLKERHMD